MLDIRRIRSDPDAVRHALARRGTDEAERVDQLLALDERWRALTAELEELRAEQNRASKNRRGAPTPEEREKLAALSARGRQLSDELTKAASERDRVLASLGNLPAEDAPEADTVLREVGEAGAGGRDHLELAGSMIDIEHGAQLSGSRFAYLRGDIVLLQLAVVRYAIEKLHREGFEPVSPPVLVREHALYGTGFLPDTEQQLYQLPQDDLYLVGTSEVALASLHRDEILDADTLPRRYAGFSSCFRREAGAAGRDTRGIFRVHQFDKVEMFAFVEPSQSEAEHERILAIEESICQELGIPYRVVNIAVSDLGASAAKKYDIEAWLPGQERFRELTSCSNTTDYQARRLDIRYRPREGRVAPVHTLNGTAVTSSRTIIALLENGQQEDGSVAIPQVLVDMGAPQVIRAGSPATRPLGVGELSHLMGRDPQKQLPPVAMRLLLMVGEASQRAGLQRVELGEIDQCAGQRMPGQAVAHERRRLAVETAEQLQLLVLAVLPALDQKAAQDRHVERLGRRRGSGRTQQVAHVVHGCLPLRHGGGRSARA